MKRRNSNSRKKAGRIDLAFREAPARESSKAVQLRGAVVEHVRIQGPATFDYSWSADRHYLATHDIRLLDGETALDGARRASPRDLRDALTFAPRGCSVSGWSSLAPRASSYTSVAFDPSLASDEMEIGGALRDAKPALYFSDPGLLATLLKIQDQLNTSADMLYLETLVVLAAIEVGRLMAGGALPAQTGSRLSPAQSRLVHEYIEEKLHTDIGLSELAGLAGLSRFHFSRTFKNTFGDPPRAYVLKRRIERAKGLLLAGGVPISVIATAVGFSSQARFAAAFREVAGCTPTQFRQKAS